MASDTRARMLDTTARLIHQHGFHGASLNAILAESGSPRGSLYFHFPGGKEQLVLEATRDGVGRITEALAASLGGGRDPAQGVRTFFLAAARELRDSGFIFGCPVAPILLDSPTESSLAKICRAALGGWQRILREGLQSAGLRRARAESLATTILAALEGGLLLSRAARATVPLRAVADEITTMLRGALPQARRRVRRRDPA